MAEVLPEIQTFARIKVCGVGGGGTSAVERMISSKLQGIEFVSINTDAQSLHHSHAQQKVHIGQNLTRGLGAGADPDVGRKAAEESEKEIFNLMKGADMIFITAGMGGGTGTGAAPLIAAAAREAGALVVGIVTKPFTFEGERRMAQAERGIDELSGSVDTLITIPNDRLLDMIDRKTSLLDAFRVVDDVLQQGVQGISDLITVHGLINLDFADVKSIMQDAGSALMGIGRAKGDNRAIEAARQAIDSPLLEVSVEGAKGVLFNITGGRNMSMHEIDEAAKVITEAIDPAANIIFGAVLDETMDDDIKITVVATGFDGEARPQRPIFRHRDEDEASGYRSAAVASVSPFAAELNTAGGTTASNSGSNGPLPEVDPFPQRPSEPVANRFSASPFIDERPAFEDDIEPLAEAPATSGRAGRQDNGRSGADDAPPLFEDDDTASLFNEPVKPAVASIEPDEDAGDEDDAAAAKPAVAAKTGTRGGTAKAAAEAGKKEEPAGRAAASKTTAKSLLNRASRAIGAAGQGSQYDEDDLDVPAFIRRKK